MVDETDEMGMGFNDEDLDDIPVTKSGVRKEDSTSSIGLKKVEKKPKTYEEVILTASAALTNKTLDQELLKTIVNFNFDKTFHNVCDRMKNHLKPEIAEKIISEVSRTFKKDYL
jgi:hypothetical protein